MQCDRPSVSVSVVLTLPPIPVRAVLPFSSVLRVELLSTLPRLCPCCPSSKFPWCCFPPCSLGGATFFPFPSWAVTCPLPSGTASDPFETVNVFFCDKYSCALYSHFHELPSYVDPACFFDRNINNPKLFGRQSRRKGTGRSLLGSQLEMYVL